MIFRIKINLKKSESFILSYIAAVQEISLIHS